MAGTTKVSMPSKVPAHMITRVIILNGRRASMQLEHFMWDALESIAVQGGLAVQDLIARIQAQPIGIAEIAENNLASAVRAFLVFYYRRAATEEGHCQAGHGIGNPFAGTLYEAPSVPESSVKKTLAHA